MSTPEEAITPQDLRILQTLISEAKRNVILRDESTGNFLDTMGTEEETHDLLGESIRCANKLFESAALVEIFAEKIKFNFRDFIDPKPKIQNGDQWNTYCRKQLEAFGFLGLADALLERAIAFREQNIHNEATSFIALNDENKQQFINVLAVVTSKTFEKMINGTISFDDVVGGYMDKDIFIELLLRSRLDVALAQKTSTEDWTKTETNFVFRRRSYAAIKDKVELDQIADHGTIEDTRKRMDIADQLKYLHI